MSHRRPLSCISSLVLVFIIATPRRPSTFPICLLSSLVGGLAHSVAYSSASSARLDVLGPLRPSSSSMWSRTIPSSFSLGHHDLLSPPSHLLFLSHIIALGSCTHCSGFFFSLFTCGPPTYMYHFISPCLFPMPLPTFMWHAGFHSVIYLRHIFALPTFPGGALRFPFRIFGPVYGLHYDIRRNGRETTRMEGIHSVPRVIR